MAAEGGAGVVIDIVLDERNPVRRIERLQGGLEQLVAGHVVGHDVTQVQALRRGVLDVAHVEIKAASVEEKAAVAGRFLVVPVVQIHGAGLRFSKQEVLHFDRPGVGMPAAFLSADEATVFRFDPGDAIHRFLFWRWQPANWQEKIIQSPDCSNA